MRRGTWEHMNTNDNLNPIIYTEEGTLECGGYTMPYSIDIRQKDIDSGYSIYWVRSPFKFNHEPVDFKKISDWRKSSKLVKKPLNYIEITKDKYRECRL